MPHSRRILVVGHDTQTTNLIRDCLEKDFYAVWVAQDWELTSPSQPDLVMLETRSNHGSSRLETLTELRAQSNLPVIVFSPRVDEVARMEAFDAGADDILGVPFSEPELLARLRALFRRLPRQSVLTFADLELHVASHIVYKSGREIVLTKKEFQILASMVANPGGVLSAQEILERAWGPKFVHYVQTLRVHIGNIRRKLGPSPWASDYIRTVPGVGYGMSRQQDTELVSMRASS